MHDGKEGGAKEMRVLRFVITNVPVDREKEVFEMLHSLIKAGVIKVSDIHFREEEMGRDN